MLLLLWFDQTRSFYCVGNNRCITVWKRVGGTCYIIPGKYYGILRPSQDYIKTTNDNAITILFACTQDVDFIISNDYNKDFIIYMNQYKVQYYPYAKRKDFINDYFEKESVKKGCDYIMIDIGEGLTVINGKKL